MKHVRALYNVPPSVRLLTAAAALAVAASLPSLAAAAGVGPPFLCVGAAGLFSASIALFGRRRDPAS
jgi:hypothetical protein